MTSNPIVVVVVAAAVVALARQLYAASPRNRRALHLVDDGHGNESLVVDVTLGGLRTLFMVDTAYAGAPVISTSFLNVQSRCAGGSVSARARSCLALLRSEVTEDDRQAGVAHRLLARTHCRAFTSGCTMRLMGIGETRENQADMLLCPSIRIDGRDDVSPVAADVLVSNPLRGTPHILTMDYLLHRAPCTLLPGRGEIVFHDYSGGFETLDATMMGGSFVVPFRVGGTVLQIVLDTGAGICLSLAPTAVERLSACAFPASGRTSVTQMGVNGERVCADVLRAEVSVGSLHLGEVDVLANDAPVQGADGYAGMAFLRALDLRFEYARVGVRFSGLPVRPVASAALGTCPGARVPACAA